MTGAYPEPVGDPSMSKLQRLHAAAQICWLLLLVVVALVLIVSAGGHCEPGEQSCLFEDRDLTSVVVIFVGAGLWAAGALAIGLMSLAIGAIAKRVRT